MEKKKNTSTIIIVVLLVLLLALGGYLAYDKVISKKLTEPKENNVLDDKDKEEEKEEINTNTEENLDVNSRQVLELYNLVVDKGNSVPHKYFDDTKDEELASSMSEKAKMLLIYHNFTNYDFKHINCSNVSPMGNFNCNDTINYKNSISKTDVERIYKRIFGPTAGLDTSVEIELSYFEKFIYNSSLDSYIRYTTVGGGEIGSSTNTSITKAVKKNDTIEIYEHVVTTFVDNRVTTNDYIYTFKLDNDGIYTFYSRKKQN